MANTVKVGCKLPHGLVMELLEPGQGIIPAPAGPRVFLKGANTVRADSKANPLVLGFAYTDVDADFAEKWFKANAAALFVKNGAVFMEAKAADAKAAAKERKDEATGLEPLNAEKDTRVSKGAGKNVIGDEEVLKRLGMAK